MITHPSGLGSFASSSSLLVCMYFEVRFESCFGTLKKSSSPLVRVDFDVKEAAKRLIACQMQTRGRYQQQIKQMKRVNNSFDS